MRDRLTTLFPRRHDEPDSIPHDKSDFECALRYRNLAEQTRIAAGGAITQSARRRLLKTARDYEVLAERFERKFRKQNA